jgi:transposase
VDGVGGLHHQPRSPARGRGPEKGAARGDEPEDPAVAARRQALGRSRGGLSTKVHLAVDGRGLPLAIVLTAGHAGDAPAFPQVLTAIRVPRAGRGRPRTRPEHIVADKAYSSRAIRAWCRQRGIGVTIPERADQAAGRRRRGSAGGRPPVFDAEVYRGRNVVERCISRLKQFRAVATRYDKLAARYRAGLHLAALVLWLRESTA